MKEFEFKSVVGQNEAGFDENTRTEALTEAVVRRLDREIGDGKYYDHIPEKHKPAVDEVVLFNNLDSDPDQLAEQVSQSWLVRQSVVPRILEHAGFRDIETLLAAPNHNDYHTSTIAGLSEKGTVLLVGERGLMSEGGGTAVSWNPLPERVHEPVYVPSVDKGARIIGPPILDKRLEIRFNEDGPYNYSSGSTAPLIKVFKGPRDASIRDVEAQIRLSDTHLKKITQRRK